MQKAHKTCSHSEMLSYPVAGIAFDTSWGIREFDAYLGAGVDRWPDSEAASSVEQHSVQ